MVAREGFEPSSTEPESAMLDRYTTELFFFIFSPQRENCPRFVIKPSHILLEIIREKKRQINNKMLTKTQIVYRCSTFHPLTISKESISEDEGVVDLAASLPFHQIEGTVT